MTVSKIMRDIKALNISEQQDIFLSLAEDLDMQNDLSEEQIGVEYAVEQFKNSNTLEDFQAKFQEIQIRSFNLMKPLGLNLSVQEKLNFKNY